MTPTENLHYAIGQLAYAIAKADGQVQNEEREKFAHIVAAELRMHDQDFNVSDIIFKVLDDDKFISAKDAYDWAMKQIRTNSHYLSPALKETFIKVMQKVARAYPPVTADEISILAKFQDEIATIYGDPVYYNNISK
jgi:uncharacterized tellurite resistance protein B-like protein